MIPAFDHTGNLPEGIYEATLGEFEKRFAHTVWRKKLFDRMLVLINDLRTIGCRTLFVDGSYVTNTRIPHDYDACWDNRSIDTGKFQQYPGLNPQNRAVQKRLYYNGCFPAFIRETRSGMLFIDFSQTDKESKMKKGIVKLEIQ